MEVTTAKIEALLPLDNTPGTVSHAIRGRNFSLYVRVARSRTTLSNRATLSSPRPPFGVVEVVVASSQRRFQERVDDLRRPNGYSVVGGRRTLHVRARL